MVYRSPYPSNIKPTTAHLDDALKDFIVHALKTLQQRGITDILGGTEIEFIEAHKGVRADKFDRLRKRLATEFQSDERKSGRAEHFSYADLLMARLHENSPLADLLLHDFGNYQDNPSIYELRLKPFPVEHLQEKHLSVILAIIRLSHTYGYEAKILSRHLSMSAKENGEGVFDPESSVYKTTGANTTALQVKAAHEAIIFLNTIDELLKYPEDPVFCNHKRPSTIRSKVGMNELRHCTEEVQYDHLNLMIALIAIVPMLAAAQSDLDIPQLQPTQYKKHGIFYTHDNAARNANNYTLSVLSGCELNTNRKDGPITLITPTNYIGAKRYQRRGVPLYLAQELGLVEKNKESFSREEEDANKKLLADFFQYTYLKPKDGGGYDIIWPDDPRTVHRNPHQYFSSLQLNLEERKALTFDRVLEMHSVRGYIRGEGIDHSQSKEEVGAQYAKRFEDSVLFKSVLPPELFAALVEAAHKTPQQFLANQKGGKGV